MTNEKFNKALKLLRPKMMNSLWRLSKGCHKTFELKIDELMKQEVIKITYLSPQN